jgi:hypothetical protein
MLSLLLATDDLVEGILLALVAHRIDLVIGVDGTLASARFSDCEGVRPTARTLPQTQVSSA